MTRKTSRARSAKIYSHAATVAVLLPAVASLVEEIATSIPEPHGAHNV